MPEITQGFVLSDTDPMILQENGVKERTNGGKGRRGRGACGGEK
jgi:hypothetical protein